MSNIVNCIGLCCPEPIIIAHRFVQKIKSGDKITVLATDPLANEDFKDYCESQGHVLVSIKTKNNVSAITIRKTE